MMLLKFATILFTYYSLVNADNDDWKQKIEYFESVQLDCAKFNTEGTIQSVQAWILPSGEVRETQNPVNDKHIYLTDNGFSLRIDRLDDPDFGIYYCIVYKGVNSTGVIKIGINVDGPYYNPAFLHDLTDGAKVGGIAAGCALVVLIFLWIFCKYLSRKRERFMDHKRRENVQLHDIVEAEKSGDDSVYYIADGITVDNVPEQQNQEQQQLEHPHTSPEQNRADRLSSSTSDHYHSIGTLEKVKSNEDGSYDNTAF